MNSATGANGSWKAGEKIWNFGFFSGYNLCIFIGIIFAFLTIAYHWKRQKYSWENLQILIIIIIPFSIFGARLYTVIFDGGWDNFFTLAGMSIYGGVIGAVIPASIYLFYRRKSLDYRTVLSIILPTVLIGQAIGRWGNFQNHEVYGHIVSEDSLNWMTFLKSHMYIQGPGGGSAEWRAPIFFYESMLNLAGYIGLVWILNDRNWLKPGVTASLYMVYYGIVRLILQVFRDSDPMNTSYIGHTGIALNLVVSSLAIIFGLFLALFCQFRFKIKVYWIKISKKENSNGLKFEIKNKELHSQKGIKIWYFTISKGSKKHSIKFNSKTTRIWVDKTFYWGSKRKYELIKPKKEVKRFFIGLRLPKFKKQEGKKLLKFNGWTSAKYERTFRIWIPDNEPSTKWSKRELNRGKRNNKSRK